MQYLKEAGVSPFELYTLKPQMVNGAQNIPLETYCFANLIILARRHNKLNTLPRFEKFMTKSQRSRHKEMLSDTEIDETFSQQHLL